MRNEMIFVSSGKLSLGRKMLTAAFVCLISTIAFSQNITNTLGASGLFIIKDASSNYLILSQPTGYLSLNKSLEMPNSTDATLGVIFKGTDRFIHNFGTSNTFMGINSGNFTMTGSNNIAIGDLSLLYNTTGNYNTALGSYSLYSNQSGERNTAAGSGSLYSNTQGDNNTAIGNGSLSLNTIGLENVAVGNQSLGANTQGTQNTALGFQALYNNTDAYGNSAVGYDALYHTTTGSIEYRNRFCCGLRNNHRRKFNLFR